MQETKFLEITSLTHGQLIDEKMAKKIVEAEPIDKLLIDGLDEKYNEIRTPANKLMIRVIMLLKKYQSLLMLVNIKAFKKPDQALD